MSVFPVRPSPSTPRYVRSPAVRSYDPPTLAASPLRCPPRGRNSRLETALWRLHDPPTLAASQLRCPPRGRNSRLEAALRRLHDPPTLAASPLRCPPRGRNSRLEAALRRSWTSRAMSGGERRGGELH